ncbi:MULTISPECIES: LysR family transcriptional regulator [unclassified Caballeronia]|uniref:LysR family transcriptional regulator n=1 Tax=unclassified Caballeronia TaxID=2646786 RepID=UPI00285F5EE2|nr:MULTISPECIES: LysR family transcriptional regulator [unclassified Caballeronia]MDR5815100.1 LysR family transcriptional regulator [Caballeronia sp. LZ033]MDR5879792.1 LysR family transcriptional regulator [Caballeronia sp. LZ032]
MELKQLRYFEVVAREGSLSRAATLLGVSQSLLTRHIQSLEQEFGLALLYRNGHGMSLTDGGKTFLASASDILMRTDSALNQMQALRSNPGGTVTIGIPPMLGEFLLVPLTRRFRAEFPDVRLKLRESVSGYLLEWLMTGKLDIGVLYNVTSLNTIGVEPLLSDEMLLIGPPDAEVLNASADSIALAETVDLQWVLPPRPHGLRTLAEDAATAQGLQLNIVVELDAMAGIFDLVEAGLGFSIAPFAAIEKRLERGTLKARRLREPSLSGVLSIAFSPKKEATLAMKALYRIVRQETESLVRNGVWRAIDERP